MKVAAAFFAFYMFFLSLVPNFGGHELLKLPTLVVHFYEHKQHNSNITLYQFITLHYLSGNILDEDHERDTNLPFKSEKACAPTAGIVIIDFSVPHFSFQVYHTVTKKLSARDILLPISQTLSSIWQPPRAV